MFDLDETLIDRNVVVRPHLDYFADVMKNYNVSYYLVTLSTKARVESLDLPNLLPFNFQAVLTREFFDNGTSQWSKSVFKSDDVEGNVLIVVDDNPHVWEAMDVPGSGFKFVYCRPFEGDPKDDEFVHITNHLKGLLDDTERNMKARGIA